ncbi:MAG: FAD-dependent pyridine nucleotide-disulfide oxidoreductase [Solirubrobacterales bacterium]|nr:FAD-dependent pyridine nucleotide-disulfide oxidoreductase [Solirubrobacterales bacterium]
MTLRAAIVGAGPSGFYAADQLLTAGFAVDLFDALPTPYGLVRAGVAPDHPKIKSVTRVYEKTAAKDGFRFFGGVELGSDITREDLLERYHAVVYAVGTATDNRLGVEGEDRPGSVAATEFVAWYNGHPDFADHQFDLASSRAVVIGNGYVAIDVARMLVLDPDELTPTDTADHAIDGFNTARVQDVIILGRRGPAQASFTNPELRELGELARADVIVHPADLEGDVPDDLSPTALRNLEILRDYSTREPSGKTHRVEFRFFRSPVELVGDEADGQVKGLRVVRNELVDGRAVATEEQEVIECGLVVRSIGYRGRPLPGVPFDERRGLIANDGGRVTGPEGDVLAGEYAVGWIKRGPSGVIGTNKKDASDTTTKVAEDAEAGALNAPTDDSDVEAWLRGRVPGLVTWDDWQRIDAHETAAGEAQGRPRVKLVRVPEMLAVAERG